MDDLGLEVGSRSDKVTLLFTRSHGVLWWDPCFLIKIKKNTMPTAGSSFASCRRSLQQGHGPRPPAQQSYSTVPVPCPPSHAPSASLFDLFQSLRLGLKLGI